jgi:nucleoside-diphosphate-sugar epimerase
MDADYPSEMDILITGGTGFIGSALAERCEKLNHRVTVLGQANNDWESRRARHLQAKGIVVILGSVLDEKLLNSVCDGKDVVVHLAAAQHETDVDDDYFRDINVNGTRNVLDASVAGGISRFVHGSTIGVYGSVQKGPLDEQSPTRPENIYGVTKLEGEHVVHEFRDRLSVSIVRISETYGPEDKRLLPMFRYVSNGWFPLIGAGGNMHQPIYIGDLVDALVALSDNDEAAGETVILAGPAPVSTEEMINSVELAVGRRSHRLRIPIMPMAAVAYALEKTLPPMHIKPPLTRRRLDFYRKSFWFDTSRAAALIGTTPSTNFAVGAQLTLEWYVANGLLVAQTVA